MVLINPYLNFAGKTEEAFKFYQSVFGTKLSLVRFKDLPGNAGVPENEKEKIMHASLPIGDKNTLMATDTVDSMKLEVGNNYYVSLNVDNESEAKNYFDKLSAGGKIEMELTKTDWSPLFGMFKDKFGIQWMVNVDVEKK